MDDSIFVNKIKLQRAKAECGPEATEEAIKAKYIALGGMVAGEEHALPMGEKSEPVDALVYEPKEEEKPKKAVSPRKKKK